MLHLQTPSRYAIITLYYKSFHIPVLTIDGNRKERLHYSSCNFKFSVVCRRLGHLSLPLRNVDES